MGGFQKWLDDVPSDTTVADAARRAVHSRLDEVARLLPLAALEHAEDIEHVHRLRVTVRRSGAVLKTYGVVLPDDETDRLRRTLKKLRRAAGPARDLDVFLERVAKRDAPDNLLDRVRRQRCLAQADILKAHKKLRGGARLQRLADVVTALTPDKGKRSRRAAVRRLAEWAPKRLAQSVDRFVNAMPSPSNSPDELHQFRIEGKRVRYAIEALAPGLPSAAREEAYPQIEALQERLGAINDHAAAAEWISQWQEGAEGEERVFLRELIAEERALAQSQSDEFHCWWDDARAAHVVDTLRSLPKVGATGR